VKALFVATAVALSGCYTFSTLGRARIVEPEHVELWGAPQALVVATSSGAGVRPIAGGGVRYGLSRVVELDGSASTSGFTLGTRLQLHRSPSEISGVDLALAPELVFTWPDKLAADLPVLFGLNLPGRNQLVLSARVAYQQQYGVGSVPHPVNFAYFGSSIGFVWQVGDHLALVPEVALLTQLYADPGFSSNVAGALGIQTGVGVLYDF
jgi:hypothetical protein